MRFSLLIAGFLFLGGCASEHLIELQARVYEVDEALAEANAKLDADAEGKKDFDRAERISNEIKAAVDEIVTAEDGKLKRAVEVGAPFLPAPWGAVATALAGVLGTGAYASRDKRKAKEDSYNEGIKVGTGIKNGG